MPPRPAAAAPPTSNGPSNSAPRAEALRRKDLSVDPAFDYHARDLHDLADATGADGVTSSHGLHDRPRRHPAASAAASPREPARSAGTTRTRRCAPRCSRATSSPPRSRSPPRPASRSCSAAATRSMRPWRLPRSSPLAEPVSNGLGSDCFAIVWDGAALHGLNASGWAPAAWDQAYFDRVNGGSMPTARLEFSVACPAAVAGWSALHRSFGKLAFGDLMAPAIRLCPSRLSRSRPSSGGNGQPGRRSEGPARLQRTLHAPRPGTGDRRTLCAARRGGHARAYRRHQRPRLLRRPDRGALVAHSRQNGGALAADDLADYRPEWVDTLSVHWGTIELHEIPPNGQGIAALMARACCATSASSLSTRTAPRRATC